MKKKILTIFCVILFVFFVEQIFSDTGIFENLELITYDYRAILSTDEMCPFNNKFKPADKNVMLVTIDEGSRRDFSNNPQLNVGSWPWRRDIWSGIIDYIEKGKPKAILFDIIFENYNDNKSNDIKFANTLKKYNNVVLATTLDTSKAFEKNDHINDMVNSKFSPTSKPLDVTIDDKKLDDQISYLFNASVADIYTQHNTMGVVNKVVDNDSVIRKSQPIFKLIKNKKAYYMPSLSFAGFLKYMGEDGKIIIKDHKIHYKGRIIPINTKGETNISWHGSINTYNYLSISKIMLSENNKNYKDYIDPSMFKDKIIVIGRTLPGTDIHVNSISSLYPGPEANVTAIDNLINDTDPANKKSRKIVERMSLFNEYILIIFACSFIALLGLYSKNAFLGFMNSFSSIILYILFCFLIFTYPSTRIWVPIVVPLYYMIMTSVAVFTYKFQNEKSQKAEVMDMFGKFVSPNVLTTLMKNPNNLILKNSRKKITVLFCDVKNFTSLSEKCNPEQLMENLNELFNIIVNVIFENNGTVDKFIGDCIMAYWGDPIASEDDAYMAVKTALQIKAKVNKLMIENEKEGKVVLDVKIGINTGEALLGLAGSTKIMSYTAMGDAVNMASRLESACSSLGRDILISQPTYEEAKSQILVLEAGEVKLKGKDAQVQVYEPIGLVNEAIIDTVQALQKIV